MSACDSCLNASFERARVTSGLEAAGISPSAAAAYLALEPAEAIEAMSERGIAPGHATGQRGADDVWTLCRHDPAFPPGLMDFSRESDVPRAIYGVGEAAHLGTAAAAAAIVGARRASAYGREVAYSLGHDLAREGVTVISGMALGIDGAAHRGALQAGRPTIAVLAGGPDLAYPRSHRLLHEQIAAAGCIISESPPGVEARRWNFVARNRIIAALSAITVWVEGSENSGARHTIDFCEQLGRVAGVVPGPINSPMSAGPNRLLGCEGVIAVRGARDVLDTLDIAEWGGTAPLFETDADPAAALVLVAIAAGARTPRALAASVPELSARDIARLLGELELAGRLRRATSGEYELC